MSKGIYKRIIGVNCGKDINSGMTGHIHTEKTKQLMRKVHKRKVLSEKHRKNIGKSLEGKPSGMLNKKHSKKTKERIGNGNTGKIRTLKMRRRYSDSKKGTKTRRVPKTAFKKSHIPWNLGLTKETDERVRNNGINTGFGLREKWKNSTFRKKQLAKILRGLFKRPTSLEKQIIEIITKYKLPFKYVGNGKFLIGYKNPDFIHFNKKVCIEVHNFFHHSEDYREKRARYFKKFGWKTIFINEKEIQETSKVLSLIS